MHVPIGDPRQGLPMGAIAFNFCLINQSMIAVKQPIFFNVFGMTEAPLLLQSLYISIFLTTAIIIPSRLHADIPGCNMQCGKEGGGGWLKPAKWQNRLHFN